jgi:hypothetical protein
LSKWVRVVEVVTRCCCRQHKKKKKIANRGNMIDVTMWNSTLGN